MLALQADYSSVACGHDHMRLYSAMEDLIRSIRKNFKIDAYRNEEAVRSQICYPVLLKLGWDVASPDQVQPEYNINRSRVDIALLHPPHKPLVFIEVKNRGKCSLLGEEQVFEYAAGRGGVPMLILTDGDEWHFYNTYGPGDFADRKVKSFLLKKDAPGDCIEIFRRYLLYDRVKTKQAFDDLRRDHEEVEQGREARRKIPEAWRRLVDKADEKLVEIVAEEVAAITTDRLTPGKADIVAFLKSSIPTHQGGRTPEGSSRRPRAGGNAPVALDPTKPRPAPPIGPGATKPVCRYKVGNQIYEGKSGIDVYMKALDHVIGKYGRFEELKNQRFNRRENHKGVSGYQISENQKDIHAVSGIKRRHQLSQGGKWVHTNLSRPQMSSFLIEVGGFYSRILNRKILDVWGSGAEVEFDIPPTP